MTESPVAAEFERAATYITRDLARSTLMEMIDIRTPTGDEGELARYIVTRLTQLGVPARLQAVSENRPNAVASIAGAGGGYNVLLTGHMDTSYDGTEEYLHGEGFKAKAINRDDWIWGLGAINMKGGLSAALLAFEAVKKSGLQLRGDLSLGAVVGEIEKAPVEEFQGENFAGYGTGTRHLVLHGLSADFAILAEHTAFKIGLGNLGCIWAKITTRGTTAHSALTNRPGIENAIARMHQVQSAIASWGAKYSEKCQFMGERPNVTVAAIRGGLPWRLSRNPVECNLYLDIRTVPGQSTEEVKRDLRSVLQACAKEKGMVEPELEFYLNDPPTQIDRNLPVVQALTAAHTSVIGTSPEMVTRRPAADSTHLTRYDVPCVVYGPGGRLHPDVRGQMHAAGEHIHVEDVVTAARVYLATILRLANQSPG
ncbi:MAG TPA: M20/M25/M40 family metallo-hydrolase [Pseudolabrys sp.]|nr:M20/M25/M40 family metallo-hydrolase [Pseudolabrys sp.]